MKKSTIILLVFVFFFVFAQSVFARQVSPLPGEGFSQIIDRLHLQMSVKELVAINRNNLVDKKNINLIYTWQKFNVPDDAFPKYIPLTKEQAKRTKIVLWGAPQENSTEAEKELQTQTKSDKIPKKEITEVAKEMNSETKRMLNKKENATKPNMAVEEMTKEAMGIFNLTEPKINKEVPVKRDSKDILTALAIFIFFVFLTVFLINIKKRIKKQVKNKKINLLYIVGFNKEKKMYFFAPINGSGSIESKTLSLLAAAIKHFKKTRTIELCFDLEEDEEKMPLSKEGIDYLSLLVAKEDPATLTLVINEKKEKAA